MKARVDYKCVRVEVSPGCVLEFKKLGDLNLEKTPVIISGEVDEKHFKKARERGLEELSTNMWGAR